MTNISVNSSISENPLNNNQQLPKNINGNLDNSENLGNNNPPSPKKKTKKTKKNKKITIKLTKKSNDNKSGNVLPKNNKSNVIGSVNNLQNKSKPDGDNGLQNKSKPDGDNGLQNKSKSDGNTGLQNKSKSDGDNALQNKSKSEGNTGLQNKSKSDGNTGLQNKSKSDGNTGLQNKSKSDGNNGLQNKSKSDGNNGLQNKKKSKKQKKQKSVRLSKKSPNSLNAVDPEWSTLTKTNISPKSLSIGMPVGSDPDLVNAKTEGKAKKQKKQKNKNEPWILSNRMTFINWINEKFNKYKIIPDENEDSCDTDGKKKKNILFSHQQFVKDYMSAYSPYRGLLIYHGLGSGKTAASIAIAEGTKTLKDVIVLLPASLEANYIGDLKKWGEKLYRLDQTWKYFECDKKSKLFNLYIDIYGISRDIAKNIYKFNQNGIWLTQTDRDLLLSRLKDMGDESLDETLSVKGYKKYEKFNQNLKSQIFEQTSSLISIKYTFKHYNGGASFLSYLTNNLEAGTNPFDNKVVVIDEVHNVISMMMGSSKIGKSLYELLFKAKNCRIIFLSGTPGINSPYEIGIMMSLLRGPIYSFNIKLTNKSNGWDPDKDTKLVYDFLYSIPTIDQIFIDSRKGEIEFTRNPYMFYNSIINTDDYKGVIYYDDKSNSIDLTTMDNEQFLEMIIEKLKSLKYNITPGPIHDYTALPITEKEFNEFFVNLDDLQIKNGELFKKRILGLISYYKGIGENVFPRVEYGGDDGEGLVYTDMSDYQFKQYETVRQIEREKENKKISKGSKKINAKKIDHTQAIAKNTNTSYYRTFSRQRCNFVFPPDIERPMNAYITKTLSKNISEENDNEVEQEISTRIEDALQALYANKEHYLTGEYLEQLSPKFSKMLENLSKSPGTSLVYSSFKSVEGLRIFGMVLEANGYSRYKLSIDKSSDSYEEICSPEDVGKPKYMIYSGSESEEEKRALREIFNSNDNMYGKKIRIFLASPAGAEGISLSNVRQVHIMEPFWHMVRLEQVMGRAVRICSHMNLPFEERTVEMFVYITKFTKQQEKTTATIMIQDQGLTSDQYIYRLAEKKREIMTSLFKLMKEAAVDCHLNIGAHLGEYPGNPIKCLTMPSLVGSRPINNNDYSYIPNINKETQDKHIKKIQIQNKLKAIKFEYNKKNYMIGSDKKTLYDFKLWNSHPAKAHVVGKIIINQKGSHDVILTGGDNIISIKETPYYFDIESRYLYDKNGRFQGDEMIKLTTTKFKPPRESSKRFFYYNKNSGIVYDFLELNENHILKEVGIVKGKKIEFIE